jgi:hypothetical protein
LGVGADTFKVDPSDAASELPVSTPEGATGVSVERPQATARASMHAAAGMQIFFRDISLFLQRVGTGARKRGKGMQGYYYSVSGFYQSTSSSAS